MSYEITKDQAEDLAARLHETGRNIYTEALNMGLPDPATEDEQEALFKAVEAAGIFKCEECNTWKTLSEREPGLDWCSECQAEMD